jgi:hypothetical protein
MDKLRFRGTILSIKPRIRLTRSFDKASHTYLGYAIRLEGWIEGEQLPENSYLQLYQIYQTNQSPSPSAKQPMLNINSKSTT